MQDYHFTSPRYDLGRSQITWRGYSPADAIVRFWATCMPDTVIASPVTCVEDGVTYHCEIRDGYRLIQIVATASQFREGEVTLTELPDLT